MHRTILGAIALAVLSLLIDVHAGRAQDKKLLETKGFGSLSGTITLKGDVPVPADLTQLMKGHTDAKCCLDEKAKAIEKVKQDWVVDPKTKGVANVVVWVMPPAGTYFEIHPKLKDRKKSKVVIDQPHCAFLPYVSAYQPYYYDGKEMVATGQELILKNSATVPHNVRAVGDGKIQDGFNINVPAKTDFNATKDLPENKKLKAQFMPLPIQCDIHTWMAAKLYVFDHPYYAITKADGSYSIPNVPAGAQVILMVHHGEAGWVLPQLKKGLPIMIKAGGNTVMDFTVKAP